MQKRESAESHLRLERTGFSVTHFALKYHWSSSRPHHPYNVPLSLYLRCLIHLHGHEPAALPTRLPHLLLTAPVGTAVPDEAGQESDDCGQAHANQQWVLEGIQHWGRREKVEGLVLRGRVLGSTGSLPPSLLPSLSVLPTPAVGCLQRWELIIPYPAPGMGSRKERSSSIEK